MDLSASGVRAWVTPPLEELPIPPHWPEQSATRFNRLAVVETPRRPGPEVGEWSAFRQLFCLLALLPLYGIECPTVAAPLLSAGNQGVAPERLFPALLDRCGDGFRHVPDLQRLVIFDRRREPLEALSQRIDEALNRSPGQRRILNLEAEQHSVATLTEALRVLRRRYPQLDEEGDLSEMLHQLESLQVTAVALGIHGRRLVERLVRRSLEASWSKSSLYECLGELRRRGANPWILSCLHQVRVFGNWMGHPTTWNHLQEVSSIDVTVMLAALQRALEEYPWKLTQERR